MPKITEYSWEELKYKKGGEDGLPGKDGAKGADGADGKSAYQVAVDNGFSGTEPEWLNSLKATGGLTTEQAAATSEAKQAAAAAKAAVDEAKVEAARLEALARNLEQAGQGNSNDYEF